MTTRLALIVMLAIPTAAAQPEPMSVSIDGLRGRVMANDGSVFVPARAGETLHAGDRILLLPGAKVQLVFAQDCRRTFRGPGQWSIPAVAACPVDPHVDYQRLDDAWLASSSIVAAHPVFDGPAFLARVGGLGRVEAEDSHDTVGP